MNTTQFYPSTYQSLPYDTTTESDERFLPFLAGLAITAPFWAGGFGYGRRCCPTAYPYPIPTPYPYPYPTPYPYTFNTYQGVVGSPYNYYYGRPYVY